MRDEQHRGSAIDALNGSDDVLDSPRQRSIDDGGALDVSGNTGCGKRGQNVLLRPAMMRGAGRPRSLGEYGDVSPRSALMVLHIRIDSRRMSVLRGDGERHQSAQCREPHGGSNHSSTFGNRRMNRRRMEKRLDPRSDVAVALAESLSISCSIDDDR